MIIGTAGHIDHGKTSLVRALTGVDTDSLKEEKARGITIDLGFAYQRATETTTNAFVDVPGHEKLIRNMLAGATGIDCVLLVVAADDGPMPQTREHLAIFDLLGLSRGVVALTKCDLVSDERVAAAQAEVATLLQGSALQAAVTVPVSCATGLGIAALREELQRAAATLPPRRDDGHFRLAVDRCFSLAGFGTVVTGTVASGRVDIGDSLVVSPRGLAVRVRGIHAQNSTASFGVAGQRCALNLTGSKLEKSDITRGDWIVAAAAHAPTTHLDVRLRLLPGETKALVHWTPVRLHLAALEVGARVVPLEGVSVLPGASLLVQLELDRPIAAMHGDRFIVRDQSAQRTLGGGTVVDPLAQPRGRRRPQRVAMLKALEAAEPAQALEGLLALHLPGGIDLTAFATARNLRVSEREALAQAVAYRALVQGNATRAFRQEQLDAFDASVRKALAAHHTRMPDSPGLSVEQLRRTLETKPPAESFAMLLEHLLGTGATLLRQGPFLRLAGHEVALLPTEQKLWERMRPWLEEAALNPPRLADMAARDRQYKPEQMTRLMRKLARMGKVYAVGSDYFVLTRHMSRLAEKAQELAEADPHRRLNVKTLRETTGMSRHFSLPLVEFFDHIGFTHRSKEGRHIRRDARAVFGGAQPLAQ